MTNELYLYTTAFEAICCILGINYDNVLEGTKNLLEAQQSIHDFIEWNYQFCEDRDIYSIEVEFQNHILVFLYEKLFLSLKSHKIFADFPDFKSIKTQDLFTKVNDWEGNSFLANSIRQIPFEKRTMLDYWFYNRFTS